MSGVMFPKLHVKDDRDIYSMLPSLASYGSLVDFDHRKLGVAQELTEWMERTLCQKGSTVVVVSRKGGSDAKGRDCTGMAHSALAMYDERTQKWFLYQILKSQDATGPVAELWCMAPVDFFYGQTGYEKNALLLIPDRETQSRLCEGITSGAVWKLAFTRKYNLLSRFDSSDSLNCNKWILMTIAAARSNNYNLAMVLDVIRSDFAPGKLRMNFIERLVAKVKPNVRSDELPLSGMVETVTPQSLYESYFFEERIFMSGS